MTTHSDYQTPMYWEYFGSPNTKKVLVNIDLQNPFGLNLRSISTSLFMSQFLPLVMPWVTAMVSFYPNAIPDDEEDRITSQTGADVLIQRIYCERHSRKTFAPEWRLGMRRRVDAYLAKGKFIQLPLQVPTPATNFQLFGLDKVPDDLKIRIPARIRAVTTSLTNRNIYQRVPNIRTSEIVLINPISKVEAMLAAAYDIPMAHSHCSEIDLFEAKISLFVQWAFDWKLANYVGILLHYVVLEKHIILLATCVYVCGQYQSEILLLAQIVALGQGFVILFKYVIRRNRPVWLPMHIGIKSGVNDIQSDESFPSGHTTFFGMITTTLFWEPGIYSVTLRWIFLILTIATGFERVKIGAHF